MTYEDNDCHRESGKMEPPEQDPGRLLCNKQDQYINACINRSAPIREEMTRVNQQVKFPGCSIYEKQYDFSFIARFLEGKTLLRKYCVSIDVVAVGISKRVSAKIYSPLL